MTLIEKTLKENTDKLLTKIALDYANNLITVPAIFERLEEELPILITQALQEQDRESRKEIVEKVRKATLWKLVPNKPRMIMVSDKELDDFLTGLAKQHNIDLKQD